MTPISFDNLPPLTKQEALEILSTSPKHLDLSSDYYKAVFHLAKYPGSETEDILIKFLKTNSNCQAVRIAKRKAVEVLALLGSYRAQPLIAKCLDSHDPYLVENAALALQKLNCKDSEIYTKVSNLLSDPRHNRRVLIQVLVSFNSRDSLQNIYSLLKDKSLSPCIRGAAISAIARLNNDRSRLIEIEAFLSSDKQNIRQMAVFDLADARGIEFISSICCTPVSPFFRIRAIDQLFLNTHSEKRSNSFIEYLDCVIKDDPEDISILHSYDKKPSIDFLINELFCTDFSRCYLSLMTFRNINQNEFWERLTFYFERLKKDYGAIYFLTILFRLFSDWDPPRRDIIFNLLYSLYYSEWPQYIKFRPSAIITMMRISKVSCIPLIPDWLNNEKTIFWTSRYAALVAIQENLSFFDKGWVENHLKSCKNDTHHFVRIKANNLLDLYFS